MRIPLLERTDAYEFKPMLAEIEERPVSPLGRTIMMLIIITIVFFALWTYFGQIDIVVTTRGTVIADGENKLLQPLDTGIVSKILIKEGDYVHKGQPMMEIDPSTTAPELQSTNENLRYSRLEIRRIKATLAGTGFGGGRGSGAEETQRQLYEASTNALQKNLASKEAELRSLESQIENEKVEKQENESLLVVAKEKEERLSTVIDIIAKEDYEKLKNDMLTYEDNIAQEGHKISQLTHEQSKVQEEIGKIESEFRQTHLQDLSEKEKDATDLSAKYKELSFKNAKQVICAPVDGHVDEMYVHTVGGVVTPAEKLVSIVPAQTPLVVKAVAQNQDIGFVAVGQSVAIKVDAFEFQKYGMFEGKVKMISRDSHEDEKKKDDGKTFDVYITPTTKFLKVEGRKEILKPGMTVNAEVKVGKRRIIEFFIYPLIKYMNEGMSVR